MSTISAKPRKQRKALLNMPFHIRNKSMKAPLDRKKYSDAGVRRVTIRKGDVVRVLRGSRAGHEGKVANVNLSRGKVSIEKALLRKADNKEVSVWFDPSNLVIINLDLSDAVRKERFKNYVKE